MTPPAKLSTRSWRRRLAVVALAVVAAAAAGVGLLAAVSLLFDDDPAHTGSKVAGHLGWVCVAAFATAMVFGAATIFVAERSRVRLTYEPLAMQPQERTPGPSPQRRPGRYR